VAWERVVALAAGGAIGRPALARALIEAGHVDTTQQAFDRYLQHRRAGLRGAPAHERQRRPCALIRQAGGCAVLAHPGQLPDPRGMVLRLIPAGLDGVEMAHPSNTPALREDLRGLAHLHGLIATGGSSFHGAMLKPDNRLGEPAPPPDAIERLEACARQRQSAAG
jgi:predicted metal-dependent phosphoesterase TrpH